MMAELLLMVEHVFQLVVTWLVVGCLTAPIVWAWYCVDKWNEERTEEWNR